MCQCQNGSHVHYDEYYGQRIEIRYNDERGCWEIVVDGNTYDESAFEAYYCPWCGEQL